MYRILATLMLLNGLHAESYTATEDYSSVLWTTPGPPLPTLCPAGCDCYPGGGVLPASCSCSSTTSLTITCAKKGALDQPLFIRQLERLINRIGPLEITQLTITGTPLATFLPTICEMKNLVSLTMRNNLPMLIPEGCFRNMSSLSTLVLSDSLPAVVPSDAFDGLTNLKSIDLRGNHISHLGRNLFVDPSKTEAKFPYLTHIDLSQNKMSGLDSWPCLFAQKANTHVDIYLDDNQIEHGKVTNFNNVSYACGKTPKMRLLLSLKGNQIHSFSEAFFNLGFTREIDMLCMYADETRIDIRYNKPDCSCMQYEYFKWFRAAVRNSRIISTLECETPSTLKGRHVSSLKLSELTCPLMTFCPENCACFQTPDDTTITIACESSFGKASLPPYLPSPLQIPFVATYLLEYYKYILRFGDGGLQTVDSRSYLPDTVIANFSFNSITNISEDAFKLLLPVKELYLHGNLLQSLDPKVGNLTFENIRVLSMHQNPWICDCETIWFKHWLSNISDVLSNRYGILCASPERLRGQNILQLNDDQFICGDPPNVLLKTAVSVLIGAIGFTLLAFIIPSYIVYKCRVRLFAKFRLHPFGKDECKGEGKKYDAFISYSENNENAAYELATLLENCHKRYKITYMKTFLYGLPIGQLFGQAVEGSKRTICLLTNSYLDDPFSMMQFDEVYSLYVADKTINRLIVIKVDDFDNNLIDNGNIKSFLRTSQYIDASNNQSYMDELRYCMPLRSVTEQRSEQGGGVTGENAAVSASAMDLEASEDSQFLYALDQENNKGILFSNDSDIEGQQHGICDNTALEPLLID